MGQQFGDDLERVAGKLQRPAAARCAARDRLQVHDGIGFTWERGIHLRLRRADADDALCGTHEWHLDRLADRQFDGPGPAHS